MEIFIILFACIVIIFIHSLFQIAYTGRFAFIKIFAAFTLTIIPIILTFQKFNFITIAFIYTLYCLLLTAFYLYKKIKRENILNNITIYPQYEFDKTFKFYEVGLLVDGKLTTEDVAAHFIYRKFHENAPYNEIDQKLEDIFQKTGGFDKYFGKLAKAETTQSKTATSYQATFSYTDHTSSALKIIYEEMKQKGYFKLNPIKLKLRLLSISVGLTFLACGILFLEKLADKNLSPISELILLTALIAAATSSVATQLTENTNKTTINLQNILGHKMFLNTVERFKITQDPETFKKVIPYFLAYGIRQDLVKEGLETFELVDK